MSDMPQPKRRRKRIQRREIELPPIGYQPSKAELEEDVRLPATPTELAKAIVQDVTVTRSATKA